MYSKTSQKTRFEVKNHQLFEGDKPVKLMPSPNWRGHIEPGLIVIHYTGDYGRAGLDWLIHSRGQKAVSAHLWISREGEVIQLVPFNCRAWHAGPSEYDGRGDCNSWAIGIENEGTGKDWPAGQVEAIADVVVALHRAYKIQATVGHEDIAIPEGRKPDPGPNFPWDVIAGKLEAAGFK